MTNTERLRALADNGGLDREAMRDAADEIEALRGGVDTLADQLASAEASEAELQLACKDLDLEIDSLRSRLAVAEKALGEIRDGTYPPPRADRGNCPHGTPLSDDCLGCIEEHASRALTSIQTTGGAPHPTGGGNG